MRHPAITRYAAALVVVLGAVAIRVALAPLLESHAPMLLFTLAVMVAAGFGGLGPGLFATLLSAGVGAYFFFRPVLSFALENRGDAAYLALFVVVGAGISLSSEQLRRAWRRSDHDRARFHALLEAVPHLFWTTDAAGRCDYLNARWVEYTGIPAASQFGSGWLACIHPDDRERVSRDWQAAVERGGGPFHQELRIRRHDGTYRWFDAHAAPMRDGGGRILKWFGSNSDIHEAYEAREALRIEQERLTRIVATAPAVICSFRLQPDGNSSFPYTSPGIRDIFGLPPEGLMADATPAFARMHPDDAVHVRESIAESARTMDPCHIEFRVHHPERREIWVEGHARPARNADGSIEWYGFLADNTGRHRIQQALRDHTAKLEALARAVELAHVIIRSPDGTIGYWGQGAAALYGWSPAEACGQFYHELLRTEFPVALDDIEAELLNLGHWEGELRHYRRDGSPIDVASHWSLLRDDAGAPRSIVEVNNDISWQKRVEADLRTSEQRLELAQAAAGIGAWDWDAASNINRCSESYGPLYGLPSGHIGPSAEEWLALIHADDRERVRLELASALKGIAPFDTEFRVPISGGKVRWLSGKGQVYRDASGAVVRMLGVNMDITERKTAAEQLRALSASLISAQEEERRRISRELHDDLTQRLCLLSIDLGRITGAVPTSMTDLSEELRFVQERAVEAAELTRHFAHELHPSILDELGIATALRSYCEEFARREQVEVEFNSANLPSSIKREAASCLYAVAQEALLNVSKHARAHKVVVGLDGAAESIRLAIADDGVGFGGAQGVPLGLGVVNMRERVRWVGGSFTLESEAGQGARLTVVVPG